MHAVRYDGNQHNYVLKATLNSMKNISFLIIEYGFFLWETNDHFNKKH